MSNIAGKSSALNVISPVRYRGWVNRIIFWAAQRWPFNRKLNGLLTLSIIHYARWVILSPKQWPNLGEGQPKEDIKYSYELFFSNFNGSWDQYIDSFSMSIPGGLDLLWKTNINYPKSVPIDPFHRYINQNEIQTAHYYNAYPLASSSDVKAAKRVRDSLLELATTANAASDEAFKQAYDAVVLARQDDLSRMEETPIVSLAAQAVVERRRVQELHA